MSGFIKKFSSTLLGLISSSSLWGATATWNLDAAGDWNVNGNWTPATFPNGIDDVANFFNVITAPRTVSLGTAAQNITIGTLNIDSGQAYTIQSGLAGNTLIFDVSAGSAVLSVTTVNGSATHSITAPITLNDTLSATTTTPITTLLGSIQGLGGITKAGTGQLELSGTSANTYTGLTTLSAGNLLLNKTAGVNALAGNVVLTGGGLLLGAANQIPNTSTLTMSNSTWDLQGFAETIATLNLNIGGTLTQGGAVLTLASAVTALSIQNRTISGPIALTGGGAIVFDATNNGTATISGTIDLGTNTTTFNIANGSAASDMNVSGVISNGGITKTGAGQLEFSGASANTYTGLTTLSAGTLLLNKTAGVNAIAGDVLVNGGSLVQPAANQISNTSTVTITSGTWNLLGSAETIGTLNFNGGTLTQGGATLGLTSAVTALSMQNRTISGPIALTGGGAIVFDATNNGTATISGAINLGTNTTTFNIPNGTATPDMSASGIISNGGITKTGAGRLQLAGASANTYTGLTTVSAGELALFKSAGVNAIAGDVLINGGTLLLQTTEQIATTSTVTVSSGTWNLANLAETIATLNFNGGTVTQSGSLILAGAATALSMQNTTLTDNVFVPNGGAIVFDASNNGTATISGALNLSNTSHTFNIANGTATTDMNISGSIDNSATLIKTGAGQLQFSGTSPNSISGLMTISAGNLLLNKTAGVNALAGDVLINGGTLLLGAANQLRDASSDVTISSGTWDLQGFAEAVEGVTLNTGGTLTQGGGVLTLGSLGLTMQNTTIAGPIVFSNGGTIAFDATNDGTATISGTIDLGIIGVTFDIADGAATTDMNVSGIISNGGVTKTGEGQLEFSGASPNAYTDLTIIQSGTLFLNKTAGVNALAGDVSLEFDGDLTLGAADQIADTSTVSIFDNCTWDLQGFAETIATLNLNTGGTLTQSGAVLTLASAGTALSMQNTTITGAIALTGGGAIVFDATSNGTATISGPIDLGTNVTDFNIADGSATTDMNVSGIISNGGVTKIGAGQLEFSGASANTYTGLTTLSAGNLLLNKTAGVNALAGDLLVNGGSLLLGAANQIPNPSTVTISGGTWDLQGFAETITTLNFNAGTLTQGGAVLTLASAATALSMQDTTITGAIALTGGGAIVFDATNNGTATLSGSIDLGTNVTAFNIADGTATTDMNVSGIISNGGVTKIGAGRLEFSGASPNTYTGLTTISTGDLLLNKTAGVNALAGDLLVNGGSLLLGAANQIANTSTVTLSGGIWNLQGFAETIGRLNFNTGTLTQGGAVLTLASAATALSMTNRVISGPIALTGGGAVVFDPTNNGTAFITDSLDLGTNITAFNIANGTALTDMNVSGIITNGGVTKIGAGRLEFSGASPNTYTGLTTISTGDLLLNKTAGVNALAGDLLVNGGSLLLGAANQIANTSTVTLSGGIWNLQGFAETIGRLNFNTGTLTQGGAVLTLASAATALSMQDTTIMGSLALTGGGAVAFDATNNGTATISGPIDLGTNVTAFNIANGTATTDMNVSGVIGNGGVTKIGAGQLEFSGASANTYTGLTTLSAGNLLLNKTAGVDALAGDVLVNGGSLLLGAANQIPNPSTVTLSNGTWNLQGFAETITTLNFNAGTVTQGGAVLTLASAATALSMQDTTIAGSIALTGGGAVAFDATNNGTATLSGPIDLGTNVTAFNIANGTATTDMNVSGVISNGGVTKIGAGQLEFSGASANTYTGLTTLSAGNLLLNKTAGVNALAGNAVLTGGSLLLGAANQIPNTSTLTMSNSTWDLQGFAETIATLNLNTGGTLTQGGAVLTLASAATALSMQDTTIAGSIALTGGGAIVFDATNNGTATISGPIDLGTNVTDFNIADGSATTDMNVSGVISNGGLNKTGLGTLVLTGGNTYSGGTLISAGTLQGNTSSLQGNITDNATLVFDQTTTGTYSDQISGTGALIKQGAGAVILSNVNSVGGITTVSSGSLVVNGSLSGAGALIVSPGGTLQGTGTISKNCSISGVLAPGNSIGTIHLVGAQTLMTGSTLEIELDPLTTDLVDIVGTLTIQPGASLNILPELGTYPSTFLYTIVQTTGGVTGTFSSVTSALPLFAGSVTYTPFDVLLQLSSLSFGSVIRGGNAAAVAKCLDQLAATPCGNLLDVISSLRTIPTEKELQEALLQIQPSAFTSLAVVQENDLSYLRNTLYNRMETSLHSCCFDNFPLNPTRDRNLTLWLTPLGAYTKQNNHHEEPGFVARSPGIVLGLDSNFGKESCLGGGIGYTYTHMHWSQQRGKANLQGAYGTLYGRWGSSHAYMQGSLIGGYSLYSTYRNIEFGSPIMKIKETAKGHHNGLEGSVHLKTGFNYGCRYITFSPFIGCDYFYVHENSFHEHGANSLNLKVKAKDADLLSSEAGVDLSHCFGQAVKSFTPFVKLSVIRESRFKGQKEKASFECGCDFSVSGLYPSRTLAGIALGLNANSLTKTLSLFYQGKFCNAYKDNSVYLQYLFRF